MDLLRSTLCSAAAVALCLLLACPAALALTSVEVVNDVQLYRAVCNQDVGTIYLRSNFTIGSSRWPTSELGPPPCSVSRNTTITGTGYQHSRYGPWIDFRFTANRVAIQPGFWLTFQNFTASNTRGGGGGEIDFVGYSPNAVVYTDDLNKNQPMCTANKPAVPSLQQLPLPPGWPQFQNWTQELSHLDTLCRDGKCWNDVLVYTSFATLVGASADTLSGGYVMAKRNTYKTCETFVSDECIRATGSGDTCIKNAIQVLLAASDGNLAVKVAVPVCVGVAALAALIAGVLYIRKRRREREAAAAAAADLESGGKGGKLGGNGAGLTGHSGGPHHRALQPYGTYGAGSGTFQYQSENDMARALAPPGLSISSATSGSTALLSATFDDGSVCIIEPGAPLGQGSYGIVLKGTCNGETVAVKVICYDRSYIKQVEDEVRFMTKFRHPNLLRAYKWVHKTRFVPAGSGAPASTVLDQLIASSRGQPGAHSKGPHGSSANDISSGTNSAAANPPPGQVAVAETWIVEEFCDYGALSTHVYGKRFMLGGCPQMVPILRVLYDIAAGMTHLADNKVIHGDLKTQNVLLATAPLAPLAPLLESPGPGADTGLTAAVSVSPADSGSGNANAKQNPEKGQQTTGGNEKAVDAQDVKVVVAAVADGPLDSPTGLHSGSAGTGEFGSGGGAVDDSVLLPPLLLPAGGGSTGDGFSTAATSCITGGTQAPVTADNNAGETATKNANDNPRSSSSNKSIRLTSIGASLPLVAKVSDFGLSRALKDGQTHHSTRTVGTVTHMPPELLRNGKMSHAMDVYAFGVMMWEMLSGRSPYKGLMYGEVVERVVVSRRRPDWPTHTPPSYIELAERCWAHEASDRPDFREVLGVLRGMLAVALDMQTFTDAVFAAEGGAGTGSVTGNTPATSKGPSTPAQSLPAVSRHSGATAHPRLVQQQQQEGQEEEKETKQQQQLGQEEEK